ncbi:hypothetical protein RJB80_11775 [Staphylococcus hominis]|uniref:hypothetical protein n=1 Tax=Staphylococcus TaxID=1279 RepID=UPI0007D966F1|nr:MULTISPECIES: hypothetical protein [Staphylococcus]MCI2839705.1 hypothetical protein [Staphylococcus hominis]MCI2854970.1 hypothetical protein [Staphylococcus hominis]MDS3888354.1 hypothetical protein [Staphylococcus hominis]OAO02837.1 hypothetical protein A3836_08615 [Staphylococcus hominis]OFO39562.1 hypothetical protein HMPREF3046_03225 [Staphylococcus sp. HMSC070D05]
MRFSHDKVSHYLRLVNDKNELHSTIVPGQLVVDCVLAYFQIEWTQFNVKYRKAIDIDEEVILKKVSHNEINVFGLNDEEKIVITKKSNHTDL